jgi:ribonuclease J
LSVTLTFYGGLREIGGTKILVKTGEGSVFLDFGKSFNHEANFFQDPYNAPFHIPSLLSIGALPDIQGLYRLNPGKPVDGVLISHPHVDHYGYVSTLSPQVPVYAGADTKELILIRGETNDRGWQNDYSQTAWRTFSSGDVVGVEGADINLMPIEVDHSVPASFGFIIQAEDKKIAYTGDLRMHGRRPEQTEHFLNLLRLNNVDVLITEGTHVEPGGRDPETELLAQMEEVYAQKLGGDAPRRVEIPCCTEDDVEARLTEIFRAATGLVVVESAPVDLDRIFSVWRAVEEARRLLVLPARTAYIVREAGRRTGIRDLPPVQGTALYLSQLRMRADKRGPHDPEDAEELVRGRRQWQHDLAHDWNDEGGLVLGLPEGREAIREGGDQIVICTPQAASLLPELAYRSDPCPITFVLSRSGPFDPGMAIDHDRLLHWLSLFGCREYYQVHVSGHAPPGDIRRIVEAARPDILVPVHTRNPEIFGQWHDNVLSRLELKEVVKIESFGA